MLYFSMPCGRHTKDECPLKRQNGNCNWSCIIYRAKIVKSGGIYIGRTRNSFHKRYTDYKGYLNRREYDHNGLTEEAGKYGIVNIKTIQFSILEQVNDGDCGGFECVLCALESDYIQQQLEMCPTKWQSMMLQKD